MKLIEIFNANCLKNINQLNGKIGVCVLMIIAQNLSTLNKVIACLVAIVIINRINLNNLNGSKLLI